MPPRDDALFQMLGDRLDDHYRSFKDLLEATNQKHEQRVSSIMDQLRMQNQDSETKHLQNTTKIGDLEKRMIELEKKADMLTTIYRFALFLLGAIGTFLTWASGLLEPLAKAWRAFKGVV